MSPTARPAAPLPPIQRSITVSWDREVAFRKFALDFATWWPRATHSIGGSRVRRVVLEPRVGGLIFEEHVDGRRFQWGQILSWDPPRALSFTFHPSREPTTAQEVEVRFEPESGTGGGTRVVLTACRWENWGKGAGRARKGYRVGWGYVLNVWAGRRTAGMAALDGVAAVARVVEILRGGTEASIARAGGEISRA
jgi:hypothetical protein